MTDLDIHQSKSSSWGVHPSRDKIPIQQAQEQKPKKTKKGKFVKKCCCVLVALFFLIFSLIILLFLANEVGIHIPVVNSVITKIEQYFRDKEEESSQVREKFVYSALSFVNPFLKDNNSLMTLLLKNELSENTVKDFVQAHEEISSFQFDISSNITYEADQNYQLQFFPVDSFSSHFIGSVSEQNLESTFDISAHQMKSTYSVQGVTKVIDSDTFLKLDGYPPILQSQDKYKGKWVLLEKDQLKDAFENSGIYTIPEVHFSLKDADVHRIYEFITDEAFNNSVSFSPDTVVMDIQCSCILIDLNEQELKQLDSIYHDLFMATDFIQDVNLASLSTLKSTLCFGKETKQIHHIEIDFTKEKSGLHSTGTIIIDLWNYNGIGLIEKPSDVLDFKVVFTDIFSEYENFLLAHQDEYVKQELQKLQLDIETYYEKSGSYPKNLKQIKNNDIELYGNKVSYTLNKNTYTLTIILPSKEKYILSGFGLK